MRDNGGTLILEHLATGNVVIVMMAVDEILNGRFGDLADLVQISLRRLRAAVTDRISDDHAGRRDDEHRLMILITENVDVVGAVDLCGCKHRLLSRRLRHCGCGTAGREDRCRKDYEPSVHGWYLPEDPKPQRASVIPAPKSRTWAVFRVSSKSSIRTDTCALFCSFQLTAAPSSTRHWQAAPTP